MLASLMFLGGWLSPVEGTFLQQYVEWMPGMGWLLAKVAFFLLLFLWFRATFPRYRYDQIMRLGWKIFIPITIVWLFFTGFMIWGKWGPWFI